jgi:hypothetical protein
VLLSIIATSALFGQNKVNITTANPAKFHLCSEAESLEIDVRNITTSTVSSITAEVIFPTGMKYEAGSVSGTGVTENNISNLQRPVFNLPNLGLAKSSTFYVKAFANCQMASYLSSGGVPSAKVVVTYSGGSNSKVTLPFTIVQPTLRVTSITNQLATINLNASFVRAITLSNGGSGKLSGFTFEQVNEAGLKLLGTSGGQITTVGAKSTHVFSKADFTSVGNSDSFLNNSESIVVYDTIKVVDCSNLKSQYQLYWGCDGSTCNTAYSSANVTINPISPNLTFTTTSGTGICSDSSYKYPQSLTITNTGNDTSRNTKVKILQGVSTGIYIYELSQIELSSLQIQYGTGNGFKSISPSKTWQNASTGNYACLGSNPIAALECLLFDIPPNQVITIRWNSSTCCQQVCGMGYYAHRWKYDATYKNQCGSIITQPETFGSYGNVHSVSLNEFSPTDVIDKQKIQFTYSFNSASFLPPTSNAETTFEFIIPAGLTHSLSKTDFQIEHDNGGTWQPNTLTKSNDTIFAIFKGVPSIALLRAELKIKVTGNCASSSNHGDFTYGLNLYYSADKTCKNACKMLVYCHSDKIRIHCSSCNTGFKFTEFEAKRTTFGQPDNDNDGLPDASGSLDMDKVKTERVMFGDTLLATFRGNIKRVGSITSWRYLKATSTISNGKYLRVADVRMKIYRSGTLLYDCNNISSYFNTSGLSRTFTFDVGVSALISASCPLYSGFLYGTKDSVELEVKYTFDYNPGGLAAETLFQNEMFLSSVSNPSGSQKYQCDTFGAKVVLISHYFTNYGRGYYTSNSCTEFEVSQNYYLSVGNCCSNYAGNNIFPYEYRNWAKISKAIIMPPEGFDVIDARLYHYRTSGTGKSTYQYFSKLTPTASSSKDTITYDLLPLHNSGTSPMIASDDGFLGVMYYKLRSNCKAPQGPSNVHYDFVMEKQNQLGSGNDTIQALTQFDIINFEKPLLELTSKQSDVNSISDTVEWDVRLSNSSNSSLANNLWISNTQNGNVKLLELVKLSNGQVIKPINGIFKLGNLPPTLLYDYRVRAIFTKCERDSFQLVAGYNCDGYPDSLADYPCVPTRIMLHFTPVNTRAQATFTSQYASVRLCDWYRYDVKIANEGEARIFNLGFDLIIRQGMEVGDSAWVIMPNNDSFLMSVPTSLGNNRYRFNLASASNYLSQKGLAGFSSSDVSSVVLRFKMKTNCNFVSGSYFLGRPSGALNCGKSVISSFAIGEPIKITGVKQPYFSSLSLQFGKLDICNYDGFAKIKFINLGPDTTGTTDKIQLLLPPGIYVDTSYQKSIVNGPTSKATITTNGQYMAEWSIPIDLVPGDSTYFEINTFVVPHEIPCGYTQILGQAIVLQPAICYANNTTCNISVATSTDLIIDSILKSVYQLNLLDATSVPNGTNEEATVDYEISNTGTDKVAGTLLKVKFVIDSNGNSVFDPGEKVIYVDTVLQSLYTNTKVKRSVSFVLTPDESCKLLIALDSTNCLCDVTTISVPPIRILNAGRDTTLCSNISVRIGTIGQNGSSYLWSPSKGISSTTSAFTSFKYTNLGKKDSTYALVLTTDKGSCSSKDTTFVTLYSAMQMELKDDIELCKGDSVIIGEVVINGKGFKSYSWSPAYGLSNANSVKAWAKPDTSITYKITVVDQIGCRLEDSSRIHVRLKPSAQFVAKDTCEESLFLFRDATVIGGAGLDSVHWTFGNLGTSTNRLAGIFIDSAQQIQTRYFVVDSNGCYDEVTKGVTAFPLPKTSFVVRDDCEQDTFLITDVSSIKSGTYSNKWVIETDTFYTTNVVHQFLNKGRYPIQLTTTSNLGCVNSWRDTITIHEKPSATITAQDVCLNQQSTIAFNRTSSDTLAQYTWELSDGTGSSQQSFSHLFADTGQYQLSLFLETGFGCRDTFEENTRVHPNPTSSFAATSVCLGDTTELVSSSNISSGSLSRYFWEVESGFVESGTDKKHLFTNYGPKQIRLAVESNVGCIDTSTKVANVYYVPVPNISIAGNCENELISFDNTSANLDSISATTWTLSSGTTYKSNTFTERFKAGSYDVKLALTSNRGCTSDSLFIFTIDPKPVADFSFEYPCLDNLVSYTDQSSTTLGSIVLNEWDNGLGASKSGLSFTEQYASLGTYSVIERVKNSFGCKDTMVKDVVVDNLVQPDFTFNDACINDTVYLSNTSAGLAPGTTSVFELGDGNIASNQNNVAHVYAASGGYQVRLALEYGQDCKYEVKHQVQVYPLPKVGFNLDPPTADILNSDITVLDQSQGAVSYRYIISDGNEFTTPGFVYHFSDSGDYTITQILTSSFGCIDSISKTLHINYMVNVLMPSAFSPNNDLINDVFAPGGVGMTQYRMEIFNRWGEKIYDAENGSWNGENAMVGIYVYVVRLVDYNGRVHHLSGTINLLK